MDVARELRDRRETAEEMFRRDDLRSQLRETLMRTARMSGDNVTEACTLSPQRIIMGGGIKKANTNITATSTRL